MANFSISDEAVLKQVAEASAAAKKFNLTAKKIANQSNSGFKFEDGDILEIHPQVAKVVPLEGDILEHLSADAAKAYYAFECEITRGDKKFTGKKISARQLYAPTVFANAQKVADDLYQAPLAEGKKRFGEQGPMTLVQDVPYVASDIKVKLTLGKVFTPVFLEDKGKLAEKHTAVRERTDYAYVEE